VTNLEGFGGEDLKNPCGKGEKLEEVQEKETHKNGRWQIADGRLME
jgi:hypothetical protein